MMNRAWNRSATLKIKDISVFGPILTVKKIDLNVELLFFWG